MDELTCPKCGDIVEGFGIHPEFMARHFVVRTEKCLNGKSEIKGPCPFCHEQITIARKSIPQPKTLYNGNDHMTKPG
jgi:hypothetical protein